VSRWGKAKKNVGPTEGRKPKLPMLGRKVLRDLVRKKKKRGSYGYERDVEAHHPRLSTKKWAGDRDKIRSY